MSGVRVPPPLPSCISFIAKPKDCNFGDFAFANLSTINIKPPENLVPLNVRPVDEQFKPELLWLGSPLNMNFSIILICIPEFLLKIALQFLVILINLL